MVSVSLLLDIKRCHSKLLLSYSALSANWLPYVVRVNVSFVFLAFIGGITFVLSRRLDPEEYETAQSREEVVDVDRKQKSDEPTVASSSQ